MKIKDSIKADDFIKQINEAIDRSGLKVSEIIGILELIKFDIMADLREPEEADEDN
jgi:hypothetical protein